ncbi:two pore domain potassium channel family protein [Bradyrhizobium jicamae]|uniref:Two pore domain potassium channel family protein n=1 Tax=Bradyrhizobium jicamae TaxID=280332 RepID=A0ABS5FZ01_9BRAD|nr:potassium channel family protein [Bradyrhizobium jicamae]MBR0801496.1 two pore domain potassium channel family protein [Bradyrhizobium jicamae]
MATDAELRRRFFRHFWKNFGVVWPIMSGLVVFQLALGTVIGILERWSVSEMIYFTFVTALTIGYGDLAPKRISSRIIALAIGFSGILLTALVAALSVRSLQDAAKDE